MGTWGTGFFENDEALDWLQWIESTEDFGRVEKVLLDVAGDGLDFLPAPQSQIALAAAELVAAMRGRPARELPDHARDWLSHLPLHADLPLVEMARKAVTAVLAESELNAVWSETGDFPVWKRQLLDLHQRLT